MAARNVQPPLTLIDDGGPVVVMVLDRETYRSVQAAVEVAFDEPESIPAEFREGATVLWTHLIAGEAG